MTAQYEQIVSKVEDMLKTFSGQALCDSNAVVNGLLDIRAIAQEGISGAQATPVREDWEREEMDQDMTEEIWASGKP